ncbi:hypothetical protein F383_23156 [Gossypium arboreum]|uniref:Uncharacterized protein n=1 Tax=Gossypium arboreum TaxID=29729 RepID=A0A0B0NYC9_GOSAR|nr:hypothetical protein F383_23156 [Gossypium arboreum]
MGRNTGVCLSRMRHTIMLHGRVSPRVPYSFKSVLSTTKAHGHIFWPCDKVSM